MKNRKYLYGYHLLNGTISIQPLEAETVRNINTMYLGDVSFQKIADSLNSRQIPYSTDAPLWNKHKVKRLLENRRYAGADDYPAIIEETVYNEVQDRIHSKTIGLVKSETRPALWLKPYLRCETCGVSLYRIGEKRPDALRFQCRHCGKNFSILDDDLIVQTAVQLAAHTSDAEEAYTPSEEVIHLSNAVNRQLEQPEKPEEIINLILRGVSARYDCCSVPEAIPPLRSLNGDTLKRFGETASHITISQDGIITVHFPEESQGRDGGNGTNG